MVDVPATMTGVFAHVDEMVEQNQDQIITSLMATDEVTGDITASGAQEAEDLAEQDGTVDAGEIETMNEQGYIYHDGEAVTADGSAALYVIDDMSTKATNLGSSAAAIGKLQQKVNNSIQRQLA